MKQPRICASIVNQDWTAIAQIEPLVELFEVRIDLIGNGWPEIARRLNKPWIACNRSVAEGGRGENNEAERIAEINQAIALGASIIDVEMRTENLKNIVALIKQRTRCLLSFHELHKTPSLIELTEIVQRQLDIGADICKVITTAQKFTDNLTTFKLIATFPQIKMVSFAMGPLGTTSRILCPLAGGYFTYASIASGQESAPGQITVGNLTKIYQLLEQNGK
ncbi:MAG: type I 3-dehydroquinate dehydratase [Dehalococcoidales bacterium]|nr:type I 3-dehydroquinate dehydratase [Dehalococcoidales bacterium]